ncbi:FAD-dependent oxidoreductase [Nocardioides sp. KR10-350]|uniref:FAD-dependent oxidoreductase n=1 Tax=Nocardioides cheoyonin TaxID=3156615 RepID=UPI0032B525D3
MTRPSVWERRRQQAPATREGPLTGGAWDVGVVGGGLTGLTTALLLARAGTRVVLIEAGRLGGGTTGRSTAKLSLLQGTMLSRLRRRHSAEVVREYVEGHRTAQAWVARLCEEHGVATQSRPAYTYANGDDGRRSVEAEHAAAREAGLDAEWLDDVPLPFATRGAVRLDGQLQLDPLDLVDVLAAEAAHHGATIVEGQRVTRVRGRSPVRLDLEGTDGTVNVDRLVLATNMPILDRGGFFARMAPARSYSVAFRTPAPAVDGMYLSADQPSRSLRDAPGDGTGEGADGGGSLLLVGGNGHVTGRSTPTSRRLEEIRAWAHERFPGAVETDAWSAQDSSPAHALPYAGPLVPGQDRLLVAGGFSKWGMTGGVAAALAVSAEILGGDTQQPEWARAWRPWGRSEVGGVPGTAMLNAEVGLELARGWVRPLRRDGTGDGVCTHLGGKLVWNDAERSWDCPLHGSRFDEDGSVLEGPAVCPVRGL